ncbi:MAG: hypothetical protein L3J07_02645 [Candidatus Magasanikbacteria bacterium]|nr:hypothetical protein [Candidatus Magasanikbacteria bacterium]
MKTDKEIKKLFKVVVVKPNLIKITFLKTSVDKKENTRKSKLIHDKIDSILNKKPDITFKIILDLRPMGSKANVSEKAKKIYTKVAKKDRIKKIAIIGDSDTQSEPLNLVLNLVSFFSTRNKVAWFSSYKEAKKWVHII